MNKKIRLSKNYEGEMQLRNTYVFKSLKYSEPLSLTKLLKLLMKNKLRDHNSSICVCEGEWWARIQSRCVLALVKITTVEKKLIFIFYKGIL